MSGRLRYESRSNLAIAREGLDIQASSTPGRISLADEILMDNQTVVVNLKQTKQTDYPLSMEALTIVPSAPTASASGVGYTGKNRYLLYGNYVQKVHKRNILIASIFRNFQTI